MTRLRPFFVLVSLGALTTAFAQEGIGYDKLSPKSQNYRRYRLAITEPTYGLAKVKTLIKMIKPSKEEEMLLVLPDAQWAKLTLAEKFTYCMLNGEVYGQNCDSMPWFIEEEKKIFAYPAEPFGGEQNWSPRQEKFLKQNRPETLRLMRETILKSKRAGSNLKMAILRLNAVELIPDLVTLYKVDRRDQDILSLLMVLMSEGKDARFLKSASYRKLYGPDASYQAYLVANNANQDLVIERAMAFYRGRKK